MARHEGRMVSEQLDQPGDERGLEQRVIARHHESGLASTGQPRPRSPRPCPPAVLRFQPRRTRLRHPAVERAAAVHGAMQRPPDAPRFRRFARSVGADVLSRRAAIPWPSPSARSSLRRARSRRRSLPGTACDDLPIQGPRQPARLRCKTPKTPSQAAF